MRPFRSRFVTALAAALLSLALFGTSASADCGPSDPGVPSICANARPDFPVGPPFRTFTPGDPGVPGATLMTPSDPGVPN
ncbi:MAG: hypothetical protein AAB284_06770 [Chloroflexota bacterium]